MKKRHVRGNCSLFLSLFSKSISSSGKEHSGKEHSMKLACVKKKEDEVACENF